VKVASQGRCREVKPFTLSYPENISSTKAGRFGLTPGLADQAAV